MKFSFTQESMLKGLSKVIGAVPTRMAMPALGNLLFRLEGNSLNVTATDLELTVTSKVDLIDSSGEGGILIQARRFHELIRELRDTTLEIEVQEPMRVLLKGEGVGVYTLPGSDPVEFPDVPSVDPQLSFELPAEHLKRMVAKTVFAVSRDEMRPILAGMLLQLRPGELRFVATDGHRLSRILRRDIDYSGEARDVVVPMKALNLALRNIDDESKPKIALAETRAMFEADDQVIITRLIDGNYPKYESVIPEDNPGHLVINADTFASSVRRVSIFANQISHQVKLSLSGSTMKLETEDPEMGGKAEEECAIDYKGSDLQIAYNANYLMDVLRQVDTEEAVFEMNTSNDAAIIHGTSQMENEDFMMLLMPIRLS